jgi:hypothetical protein
MCADIGLSDAMPDAFRGFGRPLFAPDFGANATALLINTENATIMSPCLEASTRQWGGAA